jgi:hypothetical protein
LTSGTATIKARKVKMTEQELRVLQVEMAQGAGSGDPNCCTLVLWLSRPVDSFEEAALREQLGVTVDEHDKTQAYWPDVDLEEFAKNPRTLSGKVMNAAGFGRPAREQVQQRYTRINQLVEQINAGLQQ